MGGAPTPKWDPIDFDPQPCTHHGSKGRKLRVWGVSTTGAARELLEGLGLLLGILWTQKRNPLRHHEMNP